MYTFLAFCYVILALLLKVLRHHFYGTCECLSHLFGIKSSNDKICHAAPLRLTLILKCFCRPKVTNSQKGMRRIYEQ